MKQESNQKLTDAEKILLEAEEVAAKAKKRYLNKKLKENAKPAVEETPVEEVTEAAEEVVEETPVEEVTEAAEEVVEETPVEEVPEAAEEVVEETPVEEVPEAAEEVVEETPVEEVPEAAEEVVEETPVEEVSQAPKKRKKRSKKTKGEGNNKFFKILKNLGLVLLVAALILCTISILNRCSANTPAQISSDTSNSSISSIESSSSQSSSSNTSSNIESGSSEQSGNSSSNSNTSIVEPGNPVNPEVFNMNEFKNSVIVIAEDLTEDEDISTNIDSFVDYIGEEKIKTMIKQYGEENIKEAIATYLASVPEEKMQQYIADNNLDFNPNAASEYEEMLFEADEEYKLATGKNPDGQLMSLDGYDTYKGNREAIKALILAKGDTDLLTWYTAKTEGYDLMVKQIADTEKANAYKEEVKLELVNSTESFEQFISENYSEIN